MTTIDKVEARARYLLGCLSTDNLPGRYLP